MTVTTKEILELDFSEDQKLLQVYGDNLFSTIKVGKFIYLLDSTRISKYNTIAQLDAKGNCTIFNRDKANIFVDWSHEHYGNKGEIDELPEQQIKDYISSYLEPDLDYLVEFSKDTTEFNKMLSKANSNTQYEILTALMNAGLLANSNMFLVDFTIAHTINQMQKFEEDLYTFAKIDVKNNKYDICSRLDNGKYKVIAKNGSIGNYKKMASNSDSVMFVVFNQRPKLIEELDKIETIVRQEVELSSYQAANKFIKIQETLEKEIASNIQKITDTKGFIDLSKVHYPDLDVYAEDIAKKITKYKKLTELEDKEEIIKSLTKVYSDAFIEINKSKTCLEALKAEVSM